MKLRSLRLRHATSPEDSSQTTVRCITQFDVQARKAKLCEIVGKPKLLSSDQTERLHEFLGEHHIAFSLEPNERKQTDLLTMKIHTGDAVDKKQALRRMPFAVRSEVAKHIFNMQASGVVNPSTSLWASPVVMVHKRDETHRFCVDYRGLNSVTKADVFLLTRMMIYLTSSELPTTSVPSTLPWGTSRFVCTLILPRKQLSPPPRPL